MGLTALKSHKIDTHPIWEVNYKVIDMDGSDRYQGLRCYTNGSKTNQGVGSGVCVMIHTHIMKTRWYKIVKLGTVFQAELYAIKRACELIKEVKQTNTNDEDFNRIRILSDSISAMLYHNE